MYRPPTLTVIYYDIMEKFNGESRTLSYVLYNGEKYLRVLLDSLLAQTYCNIDIYIRDDGSTDNTPLILKEYENKTVNGISIHLLWDNLGNLGYVKNFLQIIRTSGDADYYAFCDQDDYWLPDKIAHAVEVLQTKPSYKCLLYSSAYETRDTDLNFLRKGHVPTPLEKLDVGKALSLYDGGWLLGFTLVMNKTLKKKRLIIQFRKCTATIFGYKQLPQVLVENYYMMSELEHIFVVTKILLLLQNPISADLFG